MAFQFNKKLLQKLKDEKREKDNKPPDSGTSSGSTYTANRSLAVRFCSTSEIETLRATRFRWGGGLGAAYSLDDSDPLTHLTACVHFARSLGSTRALKLRGRFGANSDRYQTDIGMTLPKLHGIPEGTEVLMFYRIDDKAGDGSWALTDQEVARMILDSPEEET
jgi:hypothetical protein